jgi:hypothetical protein
MALGSVSRVAVCDREQVPSSNDSGNPPTRYVREPSNSDAWAHEPRIRRRAESIEPARHRQAVAQLEHAIASRVHASHQPRRPASRTSLARRLARAPSRQRPAPPTPFAAGSPKGYRSLDLGDAPLRAALGGPTSREVNQLFWGFVPRRVGSRVQARVGIWLIRLSGASPTAGSPQVRTLRHRSARGPSSTPSVYFPYPAAFAVG